MMEEYKNSANIEQETNEIEVGKDEGIEDQVNTNLESISKRRYAWDSPEARETIKQRIEMEFDLPIVLNFSNRQERLTDQLDDVSQQLYEIKLGIERLMEESKGHSTVPSSASLLSKTFNKSTIGTIKTDSSSVHSTKLTKNTELMTSKSQKPGMKKVSVDVFNSNNNTTEKKIIKNNITNKVRGNSVAPKKNDKKEIEVNETLKEKRSSTVNQGSDAKTKEKTPVKSKLNGTVEKDKKKREKTPANNKLNVVKQIELEEKKGEIKPLQKKNAISAQSNGGKPAQQTGQTGEKKITKQKETVAKNAVKKDIKTLSSEKKNHKGNSSTKKQNNQKKIEDTKNESETTPIENVIEDNITPLYNNEVHIENDKGGNKTEVLESLEIK